jgi:3',5'-cyclic AMP phosphodiesterase CpdA
MSFDQRLMRDKLIEDIEKRTTIGDGLENIDFILFSGDISFSGAKSEFKEVKAELIDPVREAVGKNVPIFCVPGNHDIERSRIIDISPDLRNKIAQLSTTRAWQQFNDVVTLPVPRASSTSRCRTILTFWKHSTAKVTDQSYTMYER